MAKTKTTEVPTKDPLINPDSILLSTSTQMAETLRSVIVPAINLLAEQGGLGKTDLKAFSNALNSGRPGGFASSIPNVSPAQPPHGDVQVAPVEVVSDGKVVEKNGEAVEPE